MERKTFYEFRQQDATDFARHIGARTFVKGEELFFESCPYCHGKGQGNRRSFSINLRTGQFKCFRSSCGMTGNMLILARDFDFSLGNEFDEYYEPRKKYRTLPKPKESITPKPQAIQYLEERGITEETATKYQVTVQSEHPNVLVMPFFDDKGNMISVKYRKTDFDRNTDNCKEWFEKNTKPILFGMLQCNTEHRKLVITEGQMDTLALATAGIDYAVSVPTGARGFTWVPYCWDWIITNFDEIIVFGDYERGIITLLDDIKVRFGALTVKHVEKEAYKDCKDANDILRTYGAEYLRSCVENAVPVPVRDVVSLSDVQDVDIYKLEKVRTGFRDLDRLLYGGLPFGGVTLIAGKPGDGKSTLASQIIVNAIEQDYKCFCYSGELPNYLFKAWMDFQVAGIHAYEYANQWGDKNYAVSDANKGLIRAWYKDHIWLYDATLLDDDEHAGLIRTTERMILQNGCRVILLDNLMTAIDLETIFEQNKYEAQSKFMKKLAALARKYNVLVILVAHKRKNNFSTNANDEISGSGDIANLGMITISYDRDEDIPDGNRLLKVAKNRLFGKIKPSGWEVMYDEKSKRIYGSNDDVTKDFSCFAGKFAEINETPPWEV